MKNHRREDIEEHDFDSISAGLCNMFYDSNLTDINIQFIEQCFALFGLHSHFGGLIGNPDAAIARLGMLGIALMTGGGTLMHHGPPHALAPFSPPTPPTPAQLTAPEPAAVSVLFAAREAASRAAWRGCVANSTAASSHQRQLIHNRNLGHRFFRGRRARHGCPRILGRRCRRRTGDRFWY